MGHESALELLIERISRFPELGWRMAGVLVPAGSQLTAVAGQPVLGHLDDTQRALRDTQAQRVLIALGRQQWAELERVLGSIQDETVYIQVVPDVHEFATLNCAVEDFDRVTGRQHQRIPVTRMARGHEAGDRYRVIGAGSDSGRAGLRVHRAGGQGLTSPGPTLFYGQERVGLDGRRFKMYKFRSMRVDAEASSGAVWATAGDDRRTPIGALLRATSLDELPQFWNVFAGHMSLVGPRPERPGIRSRPVRHQISHDTLRHRVRWASLAGAQVDGWRGDTLERILCWSSSITSVTGPRIWSDLNILSTVWKGFR